MNSTQANTEVKNTTTYYAIWRKSDGELWCATIDPEYEELDVLGFDSDPLKAARVDEESEEEMDAIAEFCGDTFDPADFELVRIDVSYTVNVP